jgi:hypothetical protein
VSRNTVRRHLRGGDGAAVRKAAARRVEKLDPFKGYIVDRLKAAAPDLIPASVLFREVRARGYAGGETRVTGGVGQFQVADPVPGGSVQSAVDSAIRPVTSSARATSEIGPDCLVAALRRFRLISEGLLPWSRRTGHA